MPGSSFHTDSLKARATSLETQAPPSLYPGPGLRGRLVAAGDGTVMAKSFLQKLFRSVWLRPDLDPTTAI